MGMVERSGRDRRRAINDLDYFSRKWVERRSHKERRRETGSTQDLQKHLNVTDILIKTAILVLMMIAVSLVWQIAQEI